MRILILMVSLLAIFVFAQTQMAPAVTDNGGGIVQNSSHKLLSSIRQSVAGIRSDGTSLEAGFITSELIDTSGISEPHSKPPKTPFVGEFAPNPFNSTTAITVKMTQDGNISLKLFDVSGKQIYLWSEDRKAGTYKISFTASESLPAGTYLYVIDVLDQQKTGKIAFVK